MLVCPSGARAPRLRALASVFALTVLVLAASAADGRAATRYVSPSGSGTACTSIAPCGSFDAAYAAAAPGDVVEVAGGTYPTQTISAANKTAGPQVTFRPALGATVTVADVNVWRSYVALADMTVRDVTIRKQDVATPAPVSNVTLTRLSGRNFNVFDATDVQILGGEYGPASACGGPHGGGNNSLRRLQGTVPTRILIDGVTIHDVQSYDLVACHTEGLAIFAGSDVTVRNSRFHGNSVYNIFLQNNSGPIDTITLENNWFAAAVDQNGQTNGTTVAFSTVPANVKIRHNSFNGQMSLDDNGLNPTYVGWLIEGNVGPLQWNGCSLNGIVYRYNAWTNRACGSTDVNLNVATPPYVNASNGAAQDYHLTGGPAVDLVPATEPMPALDIDGEPRPMNVRGDAGADERAGAVAQPPADTTAPDTTITAGPSGTTTSTSASFSFTSSESGSTFACRMDGGTWSSCTSPKAYSGLTDGTHTFEVRATDAAGNTDASPATRGFTVATTVTDPAPATGTRYVSTAGSDANACTQAAPCRTLGRGYRVAAPGDVVEVAAGTYADTAIALDSTKTSATDVLIRPAAGAAVTLSGGLHVAARHLELRGFKHTQRLYIDATAEDVTVRDNDLTTFMVLSDGAQAPKDISFVGGDAGPAVDANNIIASNGTATTASPQNVLIDGVRFHDFTLSAGSSAHVECLQVWAAQGLTVRNSRFQNCEVFDIFLQKLPGGSAPTPSNVLLENNVFDCCRTGFFAIRLADHAGTSWKDVTIRNNSFNKAVNLDGGVPYSNVKVVNNIGPKVDFYTGATGASGSKPAGVTVDHNVWYAGTKVGANDLVAPSGYRDAAAMDVHLVDGAAAIDRGDAANAPATDLDGDPRPQGAAPDIGADETAAATVTPPPAEPTPPADTTAPSVPANVRTTSVGTTSVALAWDASTDGGSGVAGYTVLRNGVALNATPQTGTTFTDGGLTASTTYTYTVKAVDQAGNVSASSAPLSVTTATPAPVLRTLTFTAGADAVLRKAKPNQANGTGTSLRAASSPRYDVLTRFAISGLAGRTVRSAKLRLRATEGTTTSGAVWQSGTSWTESTVTWNTAPATIGSAPVAPLPAVATGAWAEVDVTRLVQADGTIGLRLLGGADSVSFASREAAADRPQLVVVVEDSTATATTRTALAASAPVSGTAKKAKRTKVKRTKRKATKRKATKRKATKRKAGTKARRTTAGARRTAAAPAA